MADEIRRSAGGWALASFKLSQATLTALIDKKVLTRHEVADAIETVLKVGEKLPGEDGRQAKELLEAVEQSYRR